MKEHLWILLLLFNTTIMSDCCCDAVSPHVVIVAAMCLRLCVYVVLKQSAAVIIATFVLSHKVLAGRGRSWMRALTTSTYTHRHRRAHTHKHTAHWHWYRWLDAQTRPLLQTEMLVLVPSYVVFTWHCVCFWPPFTCWQMSRSSGTYQWDLRVALYLYIFMFSSHFCLNNHQIKRVWAAAPDHTLWRKQRLRNIMGTSNKNTHSPGSDMRQNYNLLVNLTFSFKLLHSHLGVLKLHGALLELGTEYMEKFLTFSGLISLKDLANHSKPCVLFMLLNGLWLVWVCARVCVF